MTKFIELLERKISGCDALGGLEREKAVYQSVLKDYKKQLKLYEVSISLERAKKYARHQHFLGTQGKDLVVFEDWKAKD